MIPNVNKNVHATPTTNNLFVRIPTFSIGSSKDLKENGTNRIMLTIVANTSVLAFSMLPVAADKKTKKDAVAINVATKTIKVKFLFFKIFSPGFLGCLDIIPFLGGSSPKPIEGIISANVFINKICNASKGKNSNPNKIIPKSISVTSVKFLEIK